MIAADTSALVAILLREEDAKGYSDAITAEREVLIGAPTAFELRLVMHRLRGEASTRGVDRMLAWPMIRIVPFEAAHLALANEALVRFGGRPARLNFGDCMSYAIAKHHGVPLLFKGADFAQTDVRSALA